MLVTGNAGIDALYLVHERLRMDPACRAQARAALAREDLQRFQGAQRPFALVIARRRGSDCAGMDAMCAAVGELSARYGGIDFVFPLNSDVRLHGAVAKRLAPLQAQNLVLCEALDYLPFVALISEGALVLTDSGAVLEEACSLGKPVVWAGPALAAGQSEQAPQPASSHRAGIVAAAAAMLDSVAAGVAQGGGSSPGGGHMYGDGQAARRMLTALERFGGVP
jgi:UDP-N-acetylglucosamine 2-epimerase (non-hydrolysing)